MTREEYVSQVKQIGTGTVTYDMICHWYNQRNTKPQFKLEPVEMQMLLQQWYEKIQLPIMIPIVEMVKEGLNREFKPIMVTRGNQLIAVL